MDLGDSWALLLPVSDNIEVDYPGAEPVSPILRLGVT